MMKQIATILLVATCTFSALAENRISPEFKNLQAIRAKKIKEIDTAYVQALKKLKLKCTKKGDLATANAIEAEIIKFNGSTKHNESTQGTSQTNDTGQPATISVDLDFIRLKNGAQINGTDNKPIYFDQVPVVFEHKKVSVLSDDIKNKPIKIEIKKPGTVHVMVVRSLPFYSGESYTKLKSEGWEEVADMRFINWDKSYKPISILSKTLLSGEHILPNEGDFGVRIIK